MHAAENIYVVKIKAKNEPLYNLPSDSQLYFSATGRAFVVYDDDHDEDPNLLHDVTDQYIVTVEKASVK
jgi:hypothetical protein